MFSAPLFCAKNDLLVTPSDVSSPHNNADSNIRNVPRMRKIEMSFEFRLLL